MRTNSKLLLVNTDMDGSQQSATRVLPHPFHHTPMSPLKLWIAMCSLASYLTLLLHRHSSLPQIFA